MANNIGLEPFPDPIDRGIYSSNLRRGGGGQKTCTFGEDQGRKPVPDRFFLFYTRKFGVLNIFRKIVA